MYVLVLQFEVEFPHAPFISTLSFVLLVCKEYVATLLELVFKAELVSLLSRFRIYVCRQLSVWGATWTMREEKKVLHRLVFASQVCESS